MWVGPCERLCFVVARGMAYNRPMSLIVRSSRYWALARREVAPHPHHLTPMSLMNWHSDHEVPMTMPMSIVVVVVQQHLGLGSRPLVMLIHCPGHTMCGDLGANGRLSRHVSGPHHHGPVAHRRNPGSMYTEPHLPGDPELSASITPVFLSNSLNRESSSFDRLRSILIATTGTIEFS